ncbi:S-layer protein [Coleofasciculus sp. H7-2]|uniref:S-layer protein n=1 Tax=Coleofasciculus sp. H7-2 TaxID=3351545 RepID=UPI00366ABF22
MKLKIATVILLATIGFVAPAKAQNPEPHESTTPSSPEQPTSDPVLEACAQDQADTLPNPFSDVPSNHWAFKAVLSMYYCGAYRGSSPPTKVKPFLQQQIPQTLQQPG